MGYRWNTSEIMGPPAGICTSRISSTIPQPRAKFASLVWASRKSSSIAFPSSLVRSRKIWPIRLWSARIESPFEEEFLFQTDSRRQVETNAVKHEIARQSHQHVIDRQTVHDGTSWR